MPFQPVSLGSPITNQRELINSEIERRPVGRSVGQLDWQHNLCLPTCFLDPNIDVSQSAVTHSLGRTAEKSFSRGGQVLRFRGSASHVLQEETFSSCLLASVANT